MKPDQHKHHRCSIRLEEYDYSQAGGYFVTICAHDHRRLLGDVVNGDMRLNEFGQIVQAAWDDLPGHYPGLELDAFVVMPNHVHGIIMLCGNDLVGAGLKPAPTGRRYPLSEIVRAFKTFSARRINALRCTPGVPVWQRNYWEHVIRDEAGLNRIREYVMTNAATWNTDRENPDAAGRDDFHVWMESFGNPSHGTVKAAHGRV